jgi:fucose 4-O-acetylase-like acetyltransferase
MKSRSSHLDVAKGITIIAVAYGHAAVLMMAYPFYTKALAVQSEIIFSFAMPLFFLISGAFQHIRLAAHNFDSRRYLVKIVTSLLVPFYALGALFLIANLLLGRLVSAPSFSSMLTSLLIKQSNGSMLPSVVLWFLFVLFVFHFITFIAVKQLRLPLASLVPVAMLLRLRFDWLDPTVLGNDKIADYFLFYLLGYLCYRKVVDRPISNPIALITFAATYIACFALGALEPHGPVALFMKPFGIPELALTLLTIGVSAQLAQHLPTGWLVNGLAYFGAFSILVYVFHMPIMTIFRAIAVALALPTNYIMLFFLFIPGALLPLLVGRVLARNKPFYKLLLGRDP